MDTIAVIYGDNIADMMDHRGHVMMDHRGHVKAKVTCLKYHIDVNMNVMKFYIF